MPEYDNEHDDQVTEALIVEEGKPKLPQDACLVMIAGADLGKRFPMKAARLTVGRSSDCEIFVNEKDISRRHAEFRRTVQGYAVYDRGSTNGTYVNDVQVKESQLRDGDLIKVGRTIFKFLESDNIESEYHEEIYKLTTTDGLTQIWNKRYLLEQLERELSRAIRYERDLAIVMFDVDHFKRVNDDHGHLTGDAVLKQIAQRVSSKIRRDDTFARYGGEEFSIIFPEIGRSEAAQIAEKVREAVAESPFSFDGTVLPVTISLGLADMADYRASLERDGVDTGGTPEPDPLRLIKLADERLYEAKRTGRNKVVWEG